MMLKNDKSQYIYGFIFGLSAVYMPMVVKAVENYPVGDPVEDYPRGRLKCYCEPEFSATQFKVPDPKKGWVIADRKSNMSLVKVPKKYMGDYFSACQREDLNKGYADCWTKHSYILPHNKPEHIKLTLEKKRDNCETKGTVMGAGGC